MISNKNLKKIVKWYKKIIAPCLNSYPRGSFKQRINNIYSHSHQRRIKRIIKDGVWKKLLDNKSLINGCKGFDSLYNAVESCSTKGFRELSIYDTAMMIGFHEGIRPRKVYLHRGARTGAERLLNKNLNSVSCLALNQLPQTLQLLKPYQIEDFLCICKDDFRLRKVTYSILNKRHGKGGCSNSGA